ncbi:hypothetical protein Tco_1065579 [Tanacetum coccineum]
MTSVWFDKWCDVCPLRNMISVRDITRFGFSLNAVVHELMLNEEWTWASNRYSKYPSIAQVIVPALNSNIPDSVLWRDPNGIPNQFSVSLAWQCIRISKNEVPWFNVVWFHQCIPRHAFHI